MKEGKYLIREVLGKGKQYPLLRRKTGKSLSHLTLDISFSSVVSVQWQHYSVTPDMGQYDLPPWRHFSLQCGLLSAFCIKQELLMTFSEDGKEYRNYPPQFSHDGTQFI